MNVSKHLIDLLNDKVKLVHSTTYQAGPTAKQLAVVEIDPVIDDIFIDQVATECAALIVFAPEKDGSLRFCIDYHMLSEVSIRD